MMWDVQKLLGQLPQPVVTILRQATPTLLEQMTEIRLRSGQPLVVTVGERTLFLSKSGTVVPAEQGFIIPQELVQETMLSLCGHSLHGIEKTLEQGFFTAQGGFRIGVCMQPYAVRQGRALSLCIRLPREVIGVASDIYSIWQCSQGLILAGPPASGKTTILRDLCRLISFGEGRIPTRTVLLDERNELGGWDGEKCAFQLGPCTDILSGLPKAEAIRRATRTLSPQVILCDEIVDTVFADFSLFLTVYIPVFAGIMTTAGQPMTGALYNVLLFGACQGISSLLQAAFVPVISCYLSLAIVTEVVPQMGLAGIVSGFKKLITWALGLTMTLFVGLLSLQSAIAGGGDNVAVKTTKFMISSLIPGVGGSLSELFMATQGCVQLVKSTVGAAGIVIAVLTFLPVLLRVALWQLVTAAGGIVGEMLGAGELSRLLKSVGSALSVMLAITLYYAMLFIVSTSLMILAFKGG